MDRHICNISHQSGILRTGGQAKTKGYKGSQDEQGIEDVWLEREQRQAHVGEDKVLCQEVQQLKQLEEEEETKKQRYT